MSYVKFSLNPISGCCLPYQVLVLEFLCRRTLAHSTDFVCHNYVKCNYIWHMDFYLCLPLYGQFPTKSGLFTYNYTNYSFLQSLLTIWMHISCSYDMLYVITYELMAWWKFNNLITFLITLWYDNYLIINRQINNLSAISNTLILWN